MSSPFRKEYRKLFPSEAARVEAIKTKAEELHELLQTFPREGGILVPDVGAREFALARTKLEECVMWATKACT